MATSTITITDGASTITLDNTVSTLTLGTSGPQGPEGPQGEGYSGVTSASNITIGLGLKTWTVTDVGAFTAGMRIRAIHSSTPTYWMEGYANVASGTTIIITVDKSSGSGSHNLWNFAVAGESGVAAATSPITYDSATSTVGFDQTAQNTTNDSRYARLGAANAFTVGGHTITNTVAATVPLRITAAASQSANIQEWRDSSSNIPSNIASDGWFETYRGIRFYTSSARTAWSTVANNTGNLAFNGDLTVGSASSGVNYGRLTSLPGSSQIGFVVRGAAATTTNLQEWQNSAGTVLGSVSSGGNLFLNSTSGNYAAGVNAGFKASSATSVPLGIAAAGGQTADLTTWYASNGSTVLAKITSGGVMQATYFQTTNSYLVAIEENSGGRLRFTKATASASNPGADMMKMYVVAGTNAGTLKLVVRAGAAGAETTVLDNIPQ